MADPISQQGLYQDGNSIFENVHILGTLEVTGIVNTETNLTAGPIKSTGSITATKFLGDGSELTGIDATTIKDSAGTVRIQGTTTGATHSGRAVINELEIESKLYDGDGNFGTSGQLLSSDGTDTLWIDASSTSVANANNVGVNANSTNADQFITFVGASSGNNPIRVDAGLKYNPNSNVLTTGGNIIPDADNAHDFGSSTKRWANIYSADLQLSNVGTGGNEVDGSEGSWTMQEGADDLFLINRVTGKKYKFNLTEIS